MNRLICLMLLLVLLLPGCRQQEEYTEPVRFYFVRNQVTYFTSDGVITSEMREAQGHRNDFEYLLKIYLAGPENPELKRVFPKNIALVKLELNDGKALVVLSDAAARLTGLDLTIACACLTATVCELTGVISVTIRAETQLLDGQKSITMDRNHLLLLDSSRNAIGE